LGAKRREKRRSQLVCAQIPAVCAVRGARLRARMLVCARLYGSLRCPVNGRSLRVGSGPRAALAGVTSLVSRVCSPWPPVSRFGPQPIGAVCTHWLSMVFLGGVEVVRALEHFHKIPWGSPRVFSPARRKSFWARGDASPDSPAAFSWSRRVGRPCPHPLRLVGVVVCAVAARGRVGAVPVLNTYHEMAVFLSGTLLCVHLC